jgi:gamma-glutamyltranspeptidase/glutathione hydrolase
MSVVDSEGNAVSLTTTLNASFGSGILVPDAGFLLNNELDDFSIKPGTPNMFGLVGGQANQLMPGKRPLSSMSPTVVRNGAGQVALVIGAPGGPRIITSVAQVILRVLGYGQSLKEAVGAPRLHQQWVPATTLLEPAWATTGMRWSGPRPGGSARCRRYTSYRMEAYLRSATRAAEAWREL